MGKLTLISGVLLLSLGACASGEYGYGTPTADYASDYASNPSPAYGYSDAEPVYPPPAFWSSGLQLEFGGRRHHHFRHDEGYWDRGD